jgi:SAM-dependent methyltransferase
MNKLLKSFKDNGVKITLLKLISLIKFIIVRKYHEYLIFPLRSKKKVFKSIYKNNYWGSDNSVSGPGSTLQYTEKIRNNLPLLINEFKINSIFDAPCGDFNWMSKIIETHNIKYYGADIVDEIIFKNQNNFIFNNVKFNQIDITEDDFPRGYDLWLCRDCLFHLSYKDIFKALNKFLDSDIPYILTTSHKGIDINNHDILTGDFRLINLFTKPFSFPEKCISRFDDYLSPEQEREMCLWTRDQIKMIIKEMNNNISK